LNWTAGIHLADPEVGDLDDVVDVDRHDVRGTDLDRWTAVGRELAARLAADGVASLPGFIRPEAISAIEAELDRACDHVEIRADRRSVYGRPDDLVDSSSACAAAFRESDWFAGHVTRDQIPPHSPAQRLYVSPLVKRLVGACVGLDRVFEYADPLAGLVATVLPSGGCYGWHYDTNEFVVTITIRPAEHGGRFEYCRNLRAPGDENLTGLGAVLDGSDRSRIRSISGAVGDLQIFLGRYSLHRVTRVDDGAARLSLVLSYANRPGVIGPVDRTRRVYGRVTEAHLLAAGDIEGSDGLLL
jgi:hypothetical protein